VGREPALPIPLEVAAVPWARATLPRAFGRTAAERAWRLAGWIGFAAVVALACWRVELSPGLLWQGLARLGWLLRLMVPPSHGGWLDEFVWALAQTLGMAFLGTLLAVLVAVPLGALGAKNVVPQRLVHFGLRRSLDALRGIDALIWALVFVHVVGLGPLAGVLALAMSDVGTLAKLVAEALENVDRGPVEGVRAAGAGRVLVFRFGMLPQVSPILVSHALYFFESNTRSASVLGVVGAGGIGYHLVERIRQNNWDEVAFLVLMILAAVTAIDAVSRALRLRIIRPRAAG
jgi:phosphonate transport system permease protein